MKINNILYRENHNDFDLSKIYEINSQDLSDLEFEILRRLIQHSGILHYAIRRLGPDLSDREISFTVEALDGTRQVITSDLKHSDDHAQLVTFVKRLGRTTAA